MRFEYDPDKSARTKADPNRLIDFEEARQIWDDPDRVTIDLPFSEEPRMAVCGKIGTRLWMAIVTERGDNIRIISVRRAHPKEERIYEQD